MSEPATRRDKRVDQIGYVNELVSNYIEAKPNGLKLKVKADMTAGERIAGDAFEGLLISRVFTTISTSAVLKLLESGEITRADACEILTVNKDEATKRVDPKRLARMTRSFPATPALQVRRLPGVEIALVDALRELSKEIVRA
jgi:hypothetical protein